jgi:hypothetical protein
MGVKLPGLCTNPCSRLHRIGSFPRPVCTADIVPGIVEIDTIAPLG